MAGAATKTAPRWLDPVMRAGYGARAGVYLVVGALAATAAFYGGNAVGTKGAMRQLADTPWGMAALLLIGVGLCAYALWRAIDGLMDLESYGADLKAVVARAGMLVTGLIHLALGVYCLSILFGLGLAGGGGGGAQGFTAQLMRQPYGRWLVIGAGLVVIGAGVYYWVKAFTEKYKRGIRHSRTTERLDPAIKAGLVAHGVVVALVGGFLAWAGWTHDPSEAGGLNQAFDALRAAPYGRVLLGATALGLVGFAAFCAVVAIYGIVPRVAGADVATLGGRTVGEVTGRARGATRSAGG